MITKSMMAVHYPLLDEVEAVKRITADQAKAALPCYSAWADVPAHLKTATGIRKAGLRRRPKQPIRAWIDTTWGSYGQYGGEYPLYDIADCLPGFTAEQKQARRERLQALHCDLCDSMAKKAFLLAHDGRCPSCQRRYDGFLTRRSDCQQWAAQMLTAGCLVLDTETTGLDAQDDRIVDLAIVDGHGDLLFESLLNPERPIPSDAIRVHGITDDMVSHAPTLAQVADQIKAFLADRPVVFYNAGFDNAFLQAAGIQVAAPECLMLRSAKYVGIWSDYFEDWKWPSLDAACSFFDVQREQRHRAAADALDSFKVLLAMRERPVTVDVEELM